MPRPELDPWAKIAALKMHELILITGCSYERRRFTLGDLWNDFRRGFLIYLGIFLINSGVDEVDLVQQTRAHSLYPITKENCSPPITCKITVTANHNLSQV